MQKSSVKETIFCKKKTFHFKEPSNRSHLIRDIA